MRVERDGATGRGWAVSARWRLNRYVSIGSRGWWRYCWAMRGADAFVGIFRNLDHVRPGRWGFFIGGFEVGSRNPGDPVGMWLKKVGLWPW